MWNGLGAMMNLANAGDVASFRDKCESFFLTREADCVVRVVARMRRA